MNQSLEFLLNLTRTQAALSRRFDGKLSGLGISEFMILYHLSVAANEKLRRVDLAERVGLTASGVTRILLPMEKIGLIKREANTQDARVSYTILAPGGKRKLSEAKECAEIFAEEIIPLAKIKNIEKLSQVLNEIDANV